MSDIDFDELDREVSKLVGNGKSDAQTPEPTDTNENVQQDKESDEVVTRENPPETNDQQDIDESRISDASVSQKPRGRFMDMVHPSSDMAKEGAAISQLSTGAERQSISPLSDSGPVDEDTSHDNTKSDGIDNSSKKEDQDTLGHQDESVSATDMPDPIDVHEALNDAKESPIDDHDRQDTALEVDMPPIGQPVSPSDDVNKPVAGPFVADAKEEKRPLGQFSDTAEAEKSESDKEIDKILSQEDGDDDKEDKPDAVQYNLPPELEKDLVAIEAGESPDEILSSVDEKDSGEKTEEKEEKTEEDSGKGVETTNKKLDDTSAALLASGSIPQQYKIAIKEKAGIKDDDSSQLFKAEHYETSPSKKSHHKSKVASVLQWFFIIIGIVLLGGTIGFAVFTFVSSQ